MKVFYFSLVFAFICGCTKEQSSHIEAYVKNSTSHQIRLVGFTKGIVNRGDTIDLKAGEEKLLGISTERGKYPSGFESDYFPAADSAFVFFDNLYKVVHYVSYPAVASPKSHIFSSNRNFFNVANYTKVSVEHKNSSAVTFTYEFTEADYQFAL